VLFCRENNSPLPENLLLLLFAFFTKHQSHIGLAHEKTTQRDTSQMKSLGLRYWQQNQRRCSETTDSFMVNVIVAQPPGHKVLQPEHVPVCRPTLALPLQETPQFVSK